MCEDSAMTTTKAMRLLGVKTKYALAHLLGIKHQAVYAWGGKVPQARQWQIESIMAKKA
jgi:hypothetical protein